MDKVTVVVESLEAELVDVHWFDDFEKQEPTGRIFAEAKVIIGDGDNTIRIKGKFKFNAPEGISFKEASEKIRGLFKQ